MLCCVVLCCVVLCFVSCVVFELCLFGRDRGVFACLLCVGVVFVCCCVLLWIVLFLLLCSGIC